MKKNSTTEVLSLMTFTVPKGDNSNKLGVVDNISTYSPLSGTELSALPVTKYHCISYQFLT